MNGGQRNSFLPFAEEQARVRHKTQNRFLRKNAVSHIEISDMKKKEAAYWGHRRPGQTSCADMWRQFDLFQAKSRGWRQSTSGVWKTLGTRRESLYGGTSVFPTYSVVSLTGKSYKTDETWIYVAFRSLRLSSTLIKSCIKSFLKPLELYLTSTDQIKHCFHFFNKCLS